MFWNPLANSVTVVVFAGCGVYVCLFEYQRSFAREWLACVTYVLY